MAKLLLKNHLLYLNRRFSSVAAAENVSVSSAKAMMKVSDSGNMKSESPAESKKSFWMRDPKTGYWIPENHFDDVDAADLRDKLLSKK